MMKILVNYNKFKYLYTSTKSIINKEKFYIQKDQTESYDRTVLNFRISKADLSKYQDEPFIRYSKWYSWKWYEQTGRSIRFARRSKVTMEAMIPHG